MLMGMNSSCGSHRSVSSVSTPVRIGTEDGDSWNIREAPLLTVRVFSGCVAISFP